MLADELFDPLDLDDALEAAFDEGGPGAVVALLKEALDDPRSLGDEGVPEYLDELIDQLAKLGRYPEAIAAAYRLIDMEPSVREEELGGIAQMHARNGDDLAARELLLELRGRVEPLEGLMNTMVLANDLGDEKLAARWLAEDLRRGLAEGWDPDLIRVHHGHLRRMTGGDPELAERVAAYLADREPPPEPVAQPKPSGPRLVWPGEGDRLDVERAMRADRSARIVTPLGAAVPWPPDRNAACWCGSGAKYKKCCGRPL